MVNCVLIIRFLVYANAISYCRFEAWKMIMGLTKFDEINLLQALFEVIIHSLYDLYIKIQK